MVGIKKVLHGPVTLFLVFEVLNLLKSYESSVLFLNCKHDMHVHSKLL
jgi:hypothetical protein